MICASYSEVNKDKIERNNIKEDSKIKINGDYRNKEHTIINDNLSPKTNKNINNNDNDKEKLIAYNSKEEKKMSDNKQESKGKEKIKLSDIIKKRYKGVNITLSLINSDTLSGEVISVYKGIIIIKGNNVTYYIEEDFVVSFH